MSNSIHSSSDCAPCRLEWRPSHWLIVSLFLLGALGACSALASEMPHVASIPLALFSSGHGAWLAAREARKPSRQLVWPFEGGPQVDGRPVDGAVLRWRGPLAFLQWRDRDGSVRRLAWWTDTLPGHARRELKLAAAGSAGVASSMAP
jgi:toxin CptA